MCKFICICKISLLCLQSKPNQNTMNITQTISEGETYEVIAHAHISKEHFELESLMYHCKTSMNAVDITDFICDYLSVDAVNELEQTIINQHN